MHPVATYIGETERYFQTRKEEHQKDVNSAPTQQQFTISAHEISENTYNTLYTLRSLCKCYVIVWWRTLSAATYVIV